MARRTEALKAENERAGGAKKSNQSAASVDENAPDAIAMLKADHRLVEDLFEKYEKTRSDARKAAIAKEVCKELIIHAMLEEEVFYPACKGQVDEELLDEAQVEHDSAKLLIRDLLEGAPTDEFFDAKMKVLSEYIKHHVREEERRSEGLFAQAREAGLDMDALAAEMRELKEALTVKAKAGALETPQPRSLAA